jgi:hypothetical protein
VEKFHLNQFIEIFKKTEALEFGFQPATSSPRRARGLSLSKAVESNMECCFEFSGFLPSQE